MSRTRIAIAALLLVGLAGCADYALNKGEYTMDSGTLDGESIALRLDVYPSDATPDLEPQSVLLEDGASWQGLQVDVAPSVRVSGRVTGFVASPIAGDPVVPGSADVPVAAAISMVQEFSVAGGATENDGAGEFQLTVPPGSDYRVEIIPDEPALLPFAVVDIVRLGGDLDLGDVYLDYGVPVWGQVLQDDGQPPRGATARLVDAASGAEGPRVELDGEGWYLLRATPGDYELVIAGREFGNDPTLRRSIAVDDDDGVRLDVDAGPAARVVVEGRLVDELGEPLRSADVEPYRVRLTAQDLPGVNGSLVIETQANSGGLFEAQVIEGTWRIEAIPPYEGLVSPVARTVEVGATALDIGDLVLPDRQLWSALVVDPQGAAAVGALAVARELGFDHYTYSGTVGQDGALELDLPAVPVELTLTPAAEGAAITRLIIDPGGTSEDTGGVVAEDTSRIELSVGVEVAGALVSDEEPVPFALVEVRDALGRLYGTAISDEEGQFQMRVEPTPSDYQ
ncbi:MAG: carboxypeptidase regulatory-like domain-containing protein [Alphaproteobacteria bacterium]|nr:carboxypeptidase regulatory-like domain-containing protein [Alphaproteobacteria bacterium]